MFARWMTRPVPQPSRIAHSSGQQERREEREDEQQARLVRGPPEPPHGGAVDHPERDHEEHPGEARLGDLAHEPAAEEQDRHVKRAPAAAARRVRAPPRRRSAERVRLAEAGKEAPKSARHVGPALGEDLALHVGPRAAGPRGHRELEAAEEHDGGGRHDSCCSRPGSRLGSAPAGQPLGTPARSRTSGRPLAWLRPEATAKPRRRPATATSAAGKRGGQPSGRGTRSPPWPAVTSERRDSQARRATDSTARSSDTRPPSPGPRRGRAPRRAASPRSAGPRPR